MLEPRYEVQLLEHKILVDQQLSRHISLANMVEYLKYLKAFDGHECSCMEMVYILSTYSSAFTNYLSNNIPYEFNTSICNSIIILIIFLTI